MWEQGLLTVCVWVLALYLGTNYFADSWGQYRVTLFGKVIFGDIWHCSFWGNNVCTLSILWYICFGGQLMVGGTMVVCLGEVFLRDTVTLSLWEHFASHYGSTLISILVLGGRSVDTYCWGHPSRHHGGTLIGEIILKALCGYYYWEGNYLLSTINFAGTMHTLTVCRQKCKIVALLLS